MCAFNILSESPHGGCDMPVNYSRLASSGQRPPGTACCNLCWSPWALTFNCSRFDAKDSLCRTSCRCILHSVMHASHEDLMQSCASLQALQYKRRIYSALPPDSTFQPLMTLYLTDNTTAEEVHHASQAGVAAFKLYPAGATTNSDSGVTDLRLCWNAMDAMAKARTHHTY